MSVKFDGDVQVLGRLVPTKITLPAEAVDASHVQAAAGIQATKLEHQHALRYGQKDGTDVVAETQVLHIVRGANGKAIEIEVVASVAPTGGDKEFSVDLQKGNQAGAFATILAAVIDYDSTKANRQVVSAVPTSQTLVAGDQLRVVVALAGSTGNQAQGLAVTVQVREDAE